MGWLVLPLLASWHGNSLPFNDTIVFAAWSIIADLCNTVDDSLLWSRVNRLVVIVSTSFLCSASRRRPSHPRIQFPMKSTDGSRNVQEVNLNSFD